jgi:gliding motility-associated-like protein
MKKRWLTFVAPLWAAPALCLLVLLPAVHLAQPPVVLHYGGTSFSASNGTDSAFCKGQSLVRIVGVGFTAAPAGEVWDSTTLSLAGLRCPVYYVSDSLLITSLPDSFPDDMLAVLSLTRYNRLGTLALPASVNRPVQLTGDHIRITYPPSPWCVGATNPQPSIRLGQGSFPGLFESRSSVPGFVVQPVSGEVLLHSGAVGAHAWAYVGAHPTCPDSMAFTGTILGRTSASLSYGGAVLLDWCQSDPPVSADRLQPPGGRFIADEGLFLSDDSLGTVVPALSLPRFYQLRYIPPQACSDTAAVTVTILRAPQVAIGLQGGHACEGLPATLKATTLDAASLVWMLDGLPLGNGADSLILASPSEGDTVTLIATSLQGCESSDTLLVQVRPRPSVQPVAAPKAILQGQLPAYSAAASLDSAALYWRLESMLPKASAAIPLATGAANAPFAGQAVPVEPAAMLPDYHPRPGERLRVILCATAQGCTGEADTLLTEVLQGVSPVFIPEAMTPDGNGMNDVWEIRWTADVRPDDYHIELFNRAGGKVLDMSPLHSGFDGGALPDGVYWWLLKDRAGRQVDSGGLTIRRK